MGSTATESSFIESPQTSYIISSDDDHLTVTTRTLFEASRSLSSATSKPLSRAIRPVVYFLIAIFILLCIVVVHGLWRLQTNPDAWDTDKMSLLQPVLLERVKSLMVTANKSIHDVEARQLLRNLSKLNPHTCYSPNCVHTSLTFLESMNFSIDPCENFYEFTCGNWKHSSSQEEHSSVSSGMLINSDQFSKINDKVIKATQDLLEKPPSDSELKSFIQARELYRQCKDVEQLEKDGLYPLWQLIDSYGGWPILGDSFQWNETFDWITIVGDLQRYSSPAILSIDVKQHSMNSLTNTIYVVHPQFFMSQEYLISPEKYPRIMSAYKEFISGLTTQFLLFSKANVNENDLSFEVDEMIKFESALASLASKDTERDGKKSGRGKAQYTIQKLQKETDLTTPSSPRYNNKIDWLRFFLRVFSTSDVEVDENQELMIHQWKYMRGLSPLLSNTNPRTLANYLIWRVLAKLTSGTTYAMRELHFKFFSVLLGMPQIPSRASTCASVVKDAFPLAIGMKIMRGITDLSAKREVEEIVEAVKNSTEKLLLHQRFGPMLMRFGISNKLSTLTQCIGYSLSFQNATAINAYYDSLIFTPEEDGMYLRKYMKLRFWLYDKMLASLEHPFDPNCWSGTSLSNIGEAYAYYDTARNSINFPIGLLQSPFYSHNVPWAVNFGAIGSIIGHEISHSVNFEGWINVGIVPELHSYWECLLRHYSGYSVPELGPHSRVNGHRTRSENLADHIGLAASYWAFQEMLANPSDDLRSNDVYRKPLVGLEMFTQSQLFFISFSHMWCVSGPQEYLADELESSSHTPGRYRVLGSLQNSADFATSWSCPRGSQMNPEVKCTSIITKSPTEKPDSIS